MSGPSTSHDACKSRYHLSGCVRRCPLLSTVRVHTMLDMQPNVPRCTHTVLVLPLSTTYGRILMRLLFMVAFLLSACGSEKKHEGAQCSYDSDCADGLRCNRHDDYYSSIQIGFCVSLPAKSPDDPTASCRPNSYGVACPYGRHESFCGTASPQASACQLVLYRGIAYGVYCCPDVDAGADTSSDAQPDASSDAGSD
jgi:hypothetical protein